ncbi:hypothetical protein OPQ81_011710 [Rhizoctonia solani]|nr:hypothetical protein OPQ81_011710 [Rhizoctonia solani]
MHGEMVRQLKTELDFLSSCAADIQHVHGIISQTCECYLHPSTINNLPSEILIRIFHLLLPQGRAINSRYTPHKLSGYNYPDYLAQVCTRWRRIAISCPTLWTYIDFPMWKPLAPLLACAETRTERSGKLPLTVDIDDSYNRTRTYFNKTYSEIWEPIADRVEALQLRVDLNDPVVHFCCSALEQIVLSRSTGIFSKLIIDTMSAGYIIPVEERDINLGYRWDTWRDLELELLESQIETKFAGLTVLHLRGCFPALQSTAYHGLVDLRLYAPSDSWDVIDEPQFIAILQASPNLQILHFATGFTAGSDKVTPVSLNDLELVDISSVTMHGSILFKLNEIIRLLAPASKPLRLRVEVNEKEGDVLGGIQDFFLRSKVESFCISGLRPLSGQFLRACLTPYLRVLVFDQCNPSISDLTRTISSDHFSSALAPSLDYWYLKAVTIPGDDLRFIANLFPNRIYIDPSCVVNDLKETSGVLCKSEINVEFPSVGEIAEDFVANLTAAWNTLH